jgi:purine nucleosidase
MRPDPPPTPLLLDTDVGTNIDDSLALAYLLRHPRCELLGVATVSGDVGRRAACAEVLCRDAGRDDVPIHCGAPGPLLIGPGQSAVPLYPAISHRPHRTDRPVGTAVEFMRRLVRERPGEITLLTIGPLTNVAVLFAVDPEIPRLLKSIVSMAGVWFPHERAFETNVLSDPLAAAMVLAATAQPESAPHTLIGLNVTTACSLAADELRTRHRAAVPPSPSLLEMAESFFRRRRTVTFNDPLAAVAVFDPDVCSYEPGVATMNVEAGGQDAARTYFSSRRGYPGFAGSQRVAKGVKVERFFNGYFDVVCGTLSGDRL